MGRTIYVTGANEKYFSMACGLAQSFKIFCSKERLYICDFGLSSLQREFLEDQGVLLRTPPQVKDDSHIFVYKAALAYFLEPLEYEAVVWIDSDCLLLAPVKRTIDRLLESTDAKEVVAVCENVADRSIEDFLGKYEAKPFLERLPAHLDLRTTPYLNSGFFVVRSRAFLRRWFDLTLSMEEHALFEQNAFNLLAYGEEMKLILLDNVRWNAHHRYLPELTLDQFSSEAKGFFLGKRQVAVVHATSSRKGDIEEREFSVRVGGKRFDGFLKIIVNPIVREYQELAIKGFVVSNRTRLEEFQLLTPA